VAYEQQLLAPLSAADRRALDRMLQVLAGRAAALAAKGKQHESMCATVPALPFP
jgi:hypothetical protein